MKKTTEDIIYSIGYAVLIGILIYVIYLGVSSSVPPHKTLYITSNHFPISVIPDSFNFNNVSEYLFYGTLQPNGTECISRVAIEVNPFNYTSQNFSSIPQITNVTNPEEVANIYYNSQITYMFSIPNGYTLLCPNIVNATRWP